MRLITVEMSAKDIVEKLTPVQKDEVYRYLWAEHIKEDVEGYLLQNPDMADGLTDEEYDDVISNVVHRYVYNNDYNCELNYWDNIDNLIEEEINNKQTER